MEDEHPGEIWNRDLIPPQPPFVKIGKESYYDPKLQEIGIEDPSTSKYGAFSILHEVAHASNDLKLPPGLQSELDADYRVILQLKSTGHWSSKYRNPMTLALSQYLPSYYDDPYAEAEHLVKKLEREADHDLRTSRLYNR